ncbi:MAG: L,D-transpeptidase [Thermomicrobiales bacterium]|jgi:hypothetical protein|nr:L,D-transpeptidase [Thermomicrobiales bacterium]
MKRTGLSRNDSPAIRARRGSRKTPRLMALVAVLLALIAPAILMPESASAQWSPPRTVYIPEAGQSIDGYFLDTWRSWGVANLGYPVTPEFEENGRIVQYFEYVRMEYWPEDPNGEYVHFGAIGRELKPVTIFRSAVPSGIVKSDNPLTPTKDLALEIRAWVPLSEKDAQRENTANWRYVPETQHAVQFAFKDFWEATGEATYLGNPITQEYIKNGVTYQVFERGQLAWTSAKGVWMIPVGEVLAQRYGAVMESQPQGDLPTYSEDLFIPPGPPANGERVIDINLSSQYMIAYQGGWVVMESYVSTGRPGFDTPPGTYYINTKLPSQTMSGVLGGEYYNVPDVPWVMYFTDVGHAIHGTYWHNNFGAVMSHGCVNLPLDVAAWMYDWAPIGTKVVIHW